MSVYRVTEIIGTSGTSWEDAAAEAIRTAAGTIRDLRVAEVVKQDIALDEAGGGDERDDAHAPPAAAAFFVRATTLRSAIEDRSVPWR